MLFDFCAPAIIYFIFTLIDVLVKTYNKHFEGALLQAFVGLLVTLLLQLLCLKNVEIIAWIIVFIPFIYYTYMIVIVYHVFGLTPIQNTNNIEVTDEEDESDGEEEESTEENGENIDEHGENNEENGENTVENEDNMGDPEESIQDNEESIEENGESAVENEELTGETEESIEYNGEGTSGQEGYQSYSQWNIYE